MITWSSRNANQTDCLRKCESYNGTADVPDPDVCVLKRWPFVVEFVLITEIIGQFLKSDYFSCTIIDKSLLKNNKDQYCKWFIATEVRNVHISPSVLGFCRVELKRSYTCFERFPGATPPPPPTTTNQCKGERRRVPPWSKSAWFLV